MQALADVCAEAGQRAVLGKVCMDQHSPDFYTEQGSAVSLAAAGEVVNYIQVSASFASNVICGTVKTWKLSETGTWQNT